eukprot:119069-Hanusia_phi.AAC.2
MMRGAAACPTSSIILLPMASFSLEPWTPSQRPREAYTLMSTEVCEAVVKATRDACGGGEGRERVERGGRAGRS